MGNHALGRSANPPDGGTHAKGKQANRERLLMGADRAPRVRLAGGWGFVGMRRLGSRGMDGGQQWSKQGGTVKHSPSLALLYSFSGQTGLFCLILVRIAHIAARIPAESIAAAAIQSMVCSPFPVAIESPAPPYLTSARVL